MERALRRRFPNSDPRDTVPHHFRRKLSLQEQIPAIGAAVGAGIGVFYLARLLLQRTPLEIAREVRERADDARKPAPPLEIAKERTGG